MTNQTDTERNEAICVLEKALKERESAYAHSVSVKERIEREPEMFTWKWEDGGYWVSVYENSPKYIKELQAAISALKSQSEAERKVEKVRAECEMRIEFHRRMDCSQAKIADQAYYRVLEVLNREGKADEREKIDSPEYPLEIQQENIRKNIEWYLKRIKESEERIKE